MCCIAVACVFAYRYHRVWHHRGLTEAEAIFELWPYPVAAAAFVLLGVVIIISAEMRK